MCYNNARRANIKANSCTGEVMDLYSWRILFYRKTKAKDAEADEL